MTDGAIQMDDATAAVVTFVLNYAAYLCEIFRGGIQSIPRGQYEGAKVLGFTYGQTMRTIICRKCLSAYYLHLPMKRLTY